MTTRNCILVFGGIVLIFAVWLGGILVLSDLLHRVLSKIGT